MSKTGTVYLVGAGCGAYDLLTIRGMRLLQQCDTVVYDSLIDPLLLHFVPEQAEKICVGKRAGKHSAAQEEIQEILVAQALAGKTVVRLKGGDPFVFGRGGEEILALQAYAIPYAVVPGISSSIAVPELAGIPVTHRQMSRSFHVITGHTADALLPTNLQRYAQLDGTLVFLMGLQHLRRIADGLLAGGMRCDMPSAVISCGGTAKQQVVKAPLAELADAVTQQGVIAPAVIVVGETTQFSFAATAVQPLEQVSVTITGTKRLTEKMADTLSALGAAVNICNRLTVKAYTENPALDQALAEIQRYRWIVLTSMNGAEIFLKRLQEKRIDLRALTHQKIAVIGSGTASFLAQHGLFADCIPETYTSAALGEALAAQVTAGERVLLLRAEKSTPVLTETLAQHQIAYDDIRTYDVVQQMPSSENSIVETDFLTFASASGVASFFEQGYTISERTKIVCIGAVTAEALQQRGVQQFALAETQTVEGMTNCIIQLAAGNVNRKTT
jgi:uroporphyrinogen III methyltransferase/synthase